MRKCMVLSLWVPLLNRPVGRFFPVMGWLRFPVRWPLGKLTFCWWKTFPALAGNIVKVDAYLCWLEDQFVKVVCAGGTVPQAATEILHELMKGRLNQR